MCSSFMNLEFADSSSIFIFCNMARRLDSESEKMENFLRLERRIISRERLSASSLLLLSLSDWLPRGRPTTSAAATGQEDS